MPCRVASGRGWARGAVHLRRPGARPRDMRPRQLQLQRRGLVPRRRLRCQAGSREGGSRAHATHGHTRGVGQTPGTSRHRHVTHRMPQSQPRAGPGRPCCVCVARVNGWQGSRHPWPHLPPVPRPSDVRRIGRRSCEAALTLGCVGLRCVGLRCVKLQGVCLAQRRGWGSGAGHRGSGSCHRGRRRTPGRDVETGLPRCHRLACCHLLRHTLHCRPPKLPCDLRCGHLSLRAPRARQPHHRRPRLPSRRHARAPRARQAVRAMHRHILRARPRLRGSGRHAGSRGRPSVRHRC